MITLGIETSCDETSVSVLEDKDTVRSNVISSSLFRHKEFGGVVPEIASRHSLEQIEVVYHEALRKAKIKPSDIDIVAVTYGPGLIGSLFVGVCFAKTLAYSLGVPLVGVNHLEAHLVASFIGTKTPSKYIGLLISGGHTSISYHHKGQVAILGQTIDDAVGEAFDKVSKLLGLGYPGGPILEKLARKGNPKAFRFTKPKLKNDLDFSYSGLKTAVLHEVQKKKYGGAKQGQRGNAGDPTKRLSDEDGSQLPNDFLCDMARCFQDAALEWVMDHATEAAHQKDCETIVVGGGVCANGYLREEFTRKVSRIGMRVLFPEKLLSLDNAGMIARRGYEIYKKSPRKANSNLKLTGIPNLKMKSCA